MSHWTKPSGTTLVTTNEEETISIGLPITTTSSTINYSVTFQYVVNGNKYFIDGVQQPTLELIEGNTYIFDWSAASTHPLRFSTTPNGTHGGGTEYTTGVTVDMVNFRTTIVVPISAPTLYYYCQYHSGMGGQANTPSSSPTIEIIAGQLPPGLRIFQNNIIGTPKQVERTTTFTFVLRATIGTDIHDRTFKIVIEGPDDPLWKTEQGRLPVGNPPINNRYFILDNEIIDFQLVAEDIDLPADKSLEFWIEKGDGELPPGISLSNTGKLSGVVEPLLALDKKSKQGQYDTANYDMYLHDFSNKSSLYFQGQVIPNYVYNPPKKLNRHYDFKVSVSDGLAIVKRNFTIFVVGEDFLRADNIVVQVGTGVFTADNTYVRTPIWITPRDFGFRRANNYVTLFLEVLKNENQRGAIRYVLQATNDDGTNSVIPEGMTIDPDTGEIAGRVAYQPAITTEYKFTVRAELLISEQNVIDVATFKDKTFTLKLLGDVDSSIAWISKTKLGTIPANQISVFKVQGTTTVPDAPLLYTLKSGKLPPGLTLQYNGEITGSVIQFNDSERKGLTFFDSDTMTFDNDTTSIDRTYTFTVQAEDRFGFSATTKQFIIEVIDDDDKQYSNLFMQPFLKESKRLEYQEFISNPANFPPTSIYRPNDPNFGIQRDIKILAYAGIETKTITEFATASKKWHRKRRFHVGELKSAVAKTPGTQDVIYEVIYIELIDPSKAKKGETKKTFVQRGPEQLKADMAAFANHPNGTPTLLDSSNVNRNTEQYKFMTDDTQLDLGDTVQTIATGETLTATADTDTDPFVFNNDPVVKADSDAVLASGGQGKKYISNITNMQDSIKALGRTEYDFLPLWMRTPQSAGEQETGFVLAIPLCYCKPGTSNEIMINLRNRTYDFKKLDIEIDRYVIDSVVGNSNDQYILFGKYNYNA